MPDQGPQMSPLEQSHTQSRAAKLRGVALATVTELATGQFAEQMRLDAAQRVIVMVRRVAVLQALADGLGQMQAPPQGWLSQLARTWDPHAMTAREFVELLSPGDVDRIVFEATAWARAVRPMPTAANEDDRLFLAAGA